MSDSQDDLLKRLSSANEQNYQVMQERMHNLMTAFAEFKGDMRAKITSVDQATHNIEQSLGEIRQGVVVLQTERPLQQIEKLEGRLKSAEERVMALENWRWYMLGIMAVLTPAVAVLTAWLSKEMAK